MMEDLIGTRLGPYRFDGLLGEGGFATVYRGYQTTLDRPVALKVLDPRLARVPQFIERFRREAEATFSLRHPNIVEVYDFQQLDGNWVMVMEYVDGPTLRDLLSAKGAYNVRGGEEEATRLHEEVFDDRTVLRELTRTYQSLDCGIVAEVGRQICAALAHAHRLNVIHRDLKPDNVLLSRAGVAKLGDFGIAIARVQDDMRLTRAGQRIGSIAYMSPEQILGRKVDASSDIYALGVTLYELLTGTVPFVGTDTAISEMHLRENPERPTALREDVPSALEQVVLRCLQKDPAARYRSADEVAQALADTISPTPLVALFASAAIADGCPVRLLVSAARLICPTCGLSFDGDGATVACAGCGRTVIREQSDVEEGRWLQTAKDFVSGFHLQPDLSLDVRAYEYERSLRPALEKQVALAVAAWQRELEHGSVVSPAAKPSDRPQAPRVLAAAKKVHETAALLQSEPVTSYVVTLDAKAACRKQVAELRARAQILLGLYHSVLGASASGTKAMTASYRIAQASFAQARAHLDEDIELRRWACAAERLAGIMLDYPHVSPRKADLEELASVLASLAATLPGAAADLATVRDYFMMPKQNQIATVHEHPTAQRQQQAAAAYSQEIAAAARRRALPWMLANIGLLAVLLAVWHPWTDMARPTPTAGPVAPWTVTVLPMHIATYAPTTTPTHTATSAPSATPTKIARPTKTATPTNTAVPTPTAVGGAAQAFADNVEFVGQVGGVALSVAVEGRYAYLGVGPRLFILDLADPAHPAFLGQTHALAGEVHSVVVMGSTAYVVGGHGGLNVIDVTDPVAPVEVGFFNTPYYAENVVLIGSVAYIAAGGGGLRMIDVANRAAPVKVGFFDTPGYAKGVAVIGSFAYVADGNGGLRVINVANPTAPVEVGFFDTPGYAYAVAMAGSTAYVADGNSGLRMIDVANPAAPVEIGFFDTPGTAQGVVVVGRTAYVVAGDSGLRVLDVTNPAAPVEVGFLNTSGYADEVTVVGNTAYVADQRGGLRVIDVANRAAPVEVGFFDTPDYAYGVVVVKGNAYIAASGSGLRVIDVANPAVPVEIGSLDTPGNAYAVAVAGNTAYVADGNSGLRVIDVANLVIPVEIGFLDTPGNAYAVAVAGSTAYIADGNRGLRVIDVAKPSVPVEISFLDTPGNAYAVALVGSTAYVADGNRGLRVIDVANPAVPVEIGFLDTPGSAQGVDVVGSTAYVADGNSGLRVIDVANRAAPVEVGFFHTPDYAYGVVVFKGTAYVAAQSAGLRVIDVMNPAAPSEVGYFWMPRVARSVAVMGSNAYIAAQNCGLIILGPVDRAAPSMKP